MVHIEQADDPVQRAAVAVAGLISGLLTFLWYILKVIGVVIIMLFNRAAPIVTDPRLQMFFVDLFERLAVLFVGVYDRFRPQERKSQSSSIKD